MKDNKKQKSLIALTLLALGIWVSASFVGFETAQANLADCPNGPLRAELTGAATGGKTPSGMVQFKDKDNNSLTVMVRSVNVAAGTSLNVFVGETNVGQITVPKNGNAQLKVDSPTVEITEGTVITVRNGETTVLAGAFACVAKGGNNPSPSPTMTTTPSPTASPTVSPSVSPTPFPTPTNSPTPFPSVTPMEMPTVSPTPTPTI